MRGKTLHVRVEPFARLAKAERALPEEEADSLGRFPGAEQTVHVPQRRARVRLPGMTQP